MSQEAKCGALLASDGGTQVFKFMLNDDSIIALPTLGKVYSLGNLTGLDLE